jgi:hypothetical protein
MAAGQVASATKVLRAFLADGPRTSRDIWPAAQSQGFAAITIRRARKELGIRFRLVTDAGASWRKSTRPRRWTVMTTKPMPGRPAWLMRKTTPAETTTNITFSRMV